MKEQILKLLDDLHVQYRWHDHPAAFTVDELANLGEDMNPIKNLLLQEVNGDRKFLVIMEGHERLNLNAVREKFGSKRLKFASDETLLDTLGITPGSVSIFCMLHKGSSDVKLVVDEAILSRDEDLGFHPNDNTATIFFAAHNLEPVLRAMDCDYTIMKLY